MTSLEPDDDAVTPAPSSGVTPAPTSGVTPAPSSGVSPAPEPPTPSTGGDGSEPTGVPVGTAPAPGRGRGCLGNAAAVLVLLSGSVGVAGYAVIHAWRALSG